MGQIPLFPPQASTLAPKTDLLLLVLIVISGIFTLAVLALMVYWGVKYRRGNPVDRSNPPDSSLKLELGWIFGLFVLAMGTYTWATIVYFQIFRPPQNAMDIYVVGQQWMWKFQHPQGPREINELHVPVGQPVRLIMISEDVIHSFFVPAFRIKYDVLPGRYTNIWFQATQTGEFPLRCAEYCGTEHAEMNGKVLVMEPREFQAWLAGEQTGQTTAPAGNQGEQIFPQLGCGSCHGQGARVSAPSLAGLFGSTVKLATGETVQADENYLRESILDPQAKVVAGFDPIMPTYKGRITEDQLVQLIAYIKSLAK